MSGPGDGGVGRAEALVRLFHPQPAAFAGFAPAAAAELPPGCRELLAHSSHMTVAMERFHGGPIRLEVVARREDAAGRYAREILLATPAGRIVQHGIVRLDLPRLAPETAAAIREESLPLGRILIATGLLCDVHDVELLRIRPAAELLAVCGGGAGGKTGKSPETFGRVATIGVAGQTVVELLEIVAPGSAK
jgi:hypothetical protein